MRRAGEPCIFEDRVCTECGECDRCELDPNKICDNCCRCIETSDADYLEIQVDDILLNTEQPERPEKPQVRQFSLKQKS